jgi:hypothetical protein
MVSLTRTPPTATPALSRRGRYAAWSALASVGLIIATIAVLVLAPLPDEVGKMAMAGLSLVFYLGMIPIAVWLGEPTRPGGAIAPIAMVIGIVGVLAAVGSSLLGMPRALPPVPAYELETSALGTIGLWLLIASPLALRDRSLSRPLAILGMLAGAGWLLPAAIMWTGLAIGSMGALTDVLEGIRQYGGYLSVLIYLIWAIWLGIRLLRRKPTPSAR